MLFYSIKWVIECSIFGKWLKMVQKFQNLYTKVNNINLNKTRTFQLIWTHFWGVIMIWVSIIIKSAEFYCFNPV